MTLQQAFFLSLLALAFLPDEIKSSLQFVTFNAGWEYRDYCIHEENTRNKYCKKQQGDSVSKDIRAVVKAIAATTEINPKDFGRRNQLAHVLLQIASGVDFIGIQEDNKVLFKGIQTIQDDVLKNPKLSKEQFHKKYLIPFKLKFPNRPRSETSADRQAVWTDEKYNKLLFNLPFYKKIVPSVNGQHIGQLYNTKTLEKIDNSKNLCFKKTDGTSDNGRPYQLSLFKYKNKKVLVVNAHGPHVGYNKKTKISRFPTSNFNEYFTKEKLSSKLTKLKMNEIDLIVFQGDLNREVKKNEIRVGSHSLKWAGSQGKAIASYCGGNAFSSKKYWTTLKGTYPKEKGKGKPDNMLWWSKTGTIQTEAKVLDYIGPVSDHMMLRGTFKL